MDSSSLQGLQHASFDLLQQAYCSYLEALKHPCAETSRKAVNDVLSQAAAAGLHGASALDLLILHRSQIRWEDMSPDQFNSFYRFAFLLCRDLGKRNLQAPVATQLWRTVLAGRFRLLDRWCAFVRDTHRTIITEDTWRQVLDFSRSVHEDLGNYDPTGAWPVMLDDFVESIRQQRLGSRAMPMDMEPLNAANPWGHRQCIAISPRSGSKRKQLDLQDVMDQLQYMPLAAEEPTGASNSGNGSTSSSGEGARQLVHAKRVRMGTNAKPPTGSPVKSPALAGLPPANRALEHLHASLGGLVVGPGGLGSSSSSPGGHGSPIIMGSPPSSSPRGGSVITGRALAGGSWRGGQGLGSVMCPYRMGPAAAGGEGGRLDPRHDSLNAIMQSTVVETLGFQ